MIGFCQYPIMPFQICNGLVSTRSYFSYWQRIEFEKNAGLRSPAFLHLKTDIYFIIIISNPRLLRNRSFQESAYTQRSFRILHQALSVCCSSFLLQVHSSSIQVLQARDLCLRRICKHL